MPWQIEDLDPETRAGLLLLGEAFARLRSSRGISQRGLANMVDLSQSSISRFEAGLAPGMRARRMARMLAVLRAGPDSLSLSEVNVHLPARSSLSEWIDQMARRDEERRTDW